MKLPAISPVELARNAPLAVDRQIEQLKQIRRARVSYDPFRTQLTGIFNPATPVFASQPAVPWTSIEKNLKKMCWSRAMQTMNLCVARSLYDFVQSEQIIGREQFFGRMHMGTTAGWVRYWLDMVLNVDGHPTVVFIDPRKAGTRLLGKGRQFVFSMMHEHIRARSPDYAQVQLAIIQFTDNPRRPLIYTDAGVTLFGHSELQAMVDQTYRLWETIVQRDRPAA